MHAARAVVPFSRRSISLIVAARDAECGSLAASAVLLVMASYGPSCWAHAATLAGRLAVNERTVRRAWRELEARGHIVQTGRSPGGIKWRVQPDGRLFGGEEKGERAIAGDRTQSPIGPDTESDRPDTESDQKWKEKVSQGSGNRVKAERPKAGHPEAERPSAGHPAAGAAGRSRLGSEGTVWKRTPRGVRAIVFGPDGQGTLFGDQQ